MNYKCLQILQFGITSNSNIRFLSSYIRLISCIKIFQFQHIPTSTITKYQFPLYFYLENINISLYNLYYERAMTYVRIRFIVTILFRNIIPKYFVYGPRSEKTRSYNSFSLKTYKYLNFQFLLKTKFLIKIIAFVNIITLSKIKLCLIEPDFILFQHVSYYTKINYLNKILLE